MKTTKIDKAGHWLRADAAASFARMVDADLWSGMSTPLPEGEVGMMNYIEDSRSLEGCYPFAVVDAISVIAHGRRQNNVAICVSQRLGKAAAQCSNQRIGSAQVNPHSQTSLVRLRTLAGFGDLQ